MQSTQHRQTARRATSTVELAFVAVVAFLFLFGIIEYARYVHLLQVVHNASIQGARFAVVRTGDGTTTNQVIEEVRKRLAGRENVDPNTGVEIPGTQWNDSGFGDAIAVRVQGEYRPILPSFLMTKQMINIDIKHMMSSEAN